MKERYIPNDLFKDPNAKIKHFTTEIGQTRDRFGNRFFSSDGLAYVDGVDDSVKAGVLMSKEGQDFVVKNPRILKDISYALMSLDPMGNGKIENNQEIDLGLGGTLQWKSYGNQSNFFILTMPDGQKYAIKTHVPKKKNRENDINQPYINEMLQTQSLATDLKIEFNRLKVQMPVYLFASGQVSCACYEEDAKNYGALDKIKIEELKLIVLDYILEKRLKNDPLWQNIDVDLPADRFKLGLTVLRNFRTKPDGTIVWIDPFFYDKLPIDSTK